MAVSRQLYLYLVFFGPLIILLIGAVEGVVRISKVLWRLLSGRRQDESDDLNILIVQSQRVTASMRLEIRDRLIEENDDELPVQR